MRRRTYEIIETARPGDRASRCFDIFIITLIALNVIAFVLETVPEIQEHYGKLLERFELVSVIIFSLEYVLRVWACVEDERFRAPVRGRLRYMRTPMAIIDLLAVLPFYLPLLGIVDATKDADLRLIRAVRLFRVFRLLKVGHVEALQTLGRVVMARKEELVITTAVLFLLLLMSSALMYTAENEAQPEAFESIPEAMWWGVATLTTVGYGDVYPVTAMGRLLASVIAILGIGMFALPTGILGAGFVEEVERRKRRPEGDDDAESAEHVCPHCGGRLD